MNDEPTKSLVCYGRNAIELYHCLKGKWVRRNGISEIRTETGIIIYDHTKDHVFAIGNDGSPMTGKPETRSSNLYQCIVCGDVPDIEIAGLHYCQDCAKKLGLLENEENATCGECGVELTKENMWSDMTCKECAERLGLLGEEEWKA